MNAVETYWHHARLFVYDMMCTLMPSHDPLYSRVATRTCVFHCQNKNKAIKYTITLGELNVTGCYNFHLVDALTHRQQNLFIDVSKIKTVTAIAENVYENRFIVDFITLGFCIPYMYMEIRFVFSEHVSCWITPELNVDIPPEILLLGCGFLKKAQYNFFFQNKADIKRLNGVSGVKTYPNSLSIDEAAELLYSASRVNMNALKNQLVDLFAPDTKNTAEAARKFKVFAANIQQVYAANEFTKILAHVTPDFLKYWIYYDA